MEKHLKYMTIKKIQQLGCGEICFLSLNGSGENNFPTHSKILNSISGVRIVGPEIYASDFHENYGETERSGEILIRGTNTTNGIGPLCPLPSPGGSWCRQNISSPCC